MTCAEGCLVPVAPANRIYVDDVAGGRNRDWREELVDMREALTQIASIQEKLQTQLQSDQMQLQAVVDSIREDMSTLLAACGTGVAGIAGIAELRKAAGARAKRAEEDGEQRVCLEASNREQHGLMRSSSEVGKSESLASRALSSALGGVVVLPSAEEERSMLRDMFEKTEAAEEEDMRRKKAKRNRLKYGVDRLRSMSKTQLELSMDTVMGAIICLNAVFIGVSMDYGENTVGWLLADTFFSLVFISEISVKVAMNGVRGHFCGTTSYSNCFDAFLIFIDLVQLSIMIIAPEAAAGGGDLPSASLFRIVRLIKLTRLLRLLRSEIFKDLLCMIQGMLGGMRTLAWSLVLFVFMVYVLALLFREFLGRKQKENVWQFFNSVPRSMFTTFRCSFGDCSTDGGVPIFEYVAKDYGWSASLFYCVFIFVITIGLFNVISAIFVESTMVAAMALEASRRKARLNDERLWTTRITTLVRRIMDISTEHSVPQRMSDAVDEIHQIAVDRSVIDQVIKDAAAVQALDELDIDPNDHAHLSDILDPDNGGTIEICELIDGLQRLRGEPRRSDIVSVDMMIRALQKVNSDILLKISEVHAVMLPGG